MSAIESVLVENRVFPPPASAVNGARISGMAAYEALCQAAEKDFEGFWAKLARENVVWTKPFTKTLDESKAPFYKWFDDGELNASANCLDKHIGTPVENKTAIVFEADGDGGGSTDATTTFADYANIKPYVSQEILYLPADEVNDRRAAALVRNVEEFHSGHGLEELAGQMGVRAEVIREVLFNVRQLTLERDQAAGCGKLNVIAGREKVDRHGPRNRS